MVRTLEKQLGKSAEYLVRDFLISRGHNVVLSENEFDSKKDAHIIVGDTKLDLEIKLETLYRMYNAFSVPIVSDENSSGVYGNQLSKCVNVDVLIFCQRPTYRDRTFKIYKAPDVGERFFKVVKNSHDRRIVAIFGVNTMKLLGTITDNDVIEKYIVRE